MERASPTLLDFEVAIVTVRSGSHMVRVSAEDATTARNLVQAECQAGEHHCPPDWCTDDVDSTVLHVRRVERGSIGAPGDRDELRSSPVWEVGSDRFQS